MAHRKHLSQEGHAAPEVKKTATQKSKQGTVQKQETKPTPVTNAEQFKEKYNQKKNEQSKKNNK